MYFVLMVGGVGTRLWPLSRRACPKQFQPLTGERSLLQQTYDLLTPLVEPEDIYVCTLAEYRRAIARQLPDIPPENYLLEPQARNTGPAMGLTAAFFAARNPEAVVATIAADLWVTKPKVFASVFRAAGETIQAHPDYVLTIGIPPTFANTTLGYIQQGEPFATTREWTVFRVRRFVEKPDLPTAEQYLVSGKYLWNAGYFVWNPRTVLELFRQHQPELHARLRRFQAVQGTSQAGKVLAAEYAQMEPLSFDQGIVERTDQVLVLPADLGWYEIGNWEALHRALAEVKGTDLIVRGRHLSVNTRNCLIYGQEKLVVTVGLEGLVVVETPEVILVCAKEQAPEVKQIVARLQEEGEEQYL